MKINCPKCNQKLNVPDGAAGKKGRCPKCKDIIDIPYELAIIEDEENNRIEESKDESTVKITSQTNGVKSEASKNGEVPQEDFNREEKMKNVRERHDKGDFDGTTVMNTKIEAVSTGPVNKNENEDVAKNFNDQMGSPPNVKLNRIKSVVIHILLSFFIFILYLISSIAIGELDGRRDVYSDLGQGTVLYLIIIWIASAILKARFPRMLKIYRITIASLIVLGLAFSATIIKDTYGINVLNVSESKKKKALVSDLQKTINQQTPENADPENAVFIEMFSTIMDSYAQTEKELYQKLEEIELNRTLKPQHIVNIKELRKSKIILNDAIGLIDKCHKDQLEFWDSEVENIVLSSKVDRIKAKHFLDGMNKSKIKAINYSDDMYSLRIEQIRAIEAVIDFLINKYGVYTVESDAIIFHHSGDLNTYNKLMANVSMLAEKEEDYIKNKSMDAKNRYADFEKEIMNLEY